MDGRIPHFSSCPFFLSSLSQSWKSRLSSWWFQPIWKILVESNWIIFPWFVISNNHLAYHDFKEISHVLSMFAGRDPLSHWPVGQSQRRGMALVAKLHFFTTKIGWDNISTNSRWKSMELLTTICKNPWYYVWQGILKILNIEVIKKNLWGAESPSQIVLPKPLRFLNVFNDLPVFFLLLPLVVPPNYSSQIDMFLWHRTEPRRVTTGRRCSDTSTYEGGF